MTVSDTKARHYISVQADAAAVAYRRFRLVTTTPSMRIRGVSDSEEDEEAVEAMCMYLVRLEIFGALPATAPASPEAGAGRKW